MDMWLTELVVKNALEKYLITEFVVIDANRG